MAVPLLVKAATKILAKKAVAAGANKATQEGGPGLLLAIGAIGAIIMMLAPVILVGLLISIVSGSGQKADDCGGGGSSAASALALSDIPAVALDAYQKAGTTTGIDWVYLAAIGKVESQHGNFHGSTLQADGTVAPPILGIPLNGTNNTQAIRDTDHGRWDTDTVWDRAVGPMQFIPTTWAGEGKDGNLDGVNDPNNMFDAILAAAFKLRRDGAPGDMATAIWQYNHSQKYVDDVMATAASYRGDAAAVGTATASSSGGAAPSAAATSGASSWIRPVPEQYKVTSPFGYRGSAATGGVGTAFHEGLDFGAPVGTQIMVIGDGIVTFAGPNGGYGIMVKVEHPNGIASEYGHMSKASVTVGQVIKQGTVVGLSGNTGNSTGPHLHLNVKVNGAYVDPATFLAGAGVGVAINAGGSCGGDITGQTGNTAWGGYQNGRIPATAMCSLSWNTAHYLRCDAATALEDLNTAYKAQFGSNLKVTDTYRSYEAQVTCRQNKGQLCAQPGTSNHGWGLAIDVFGGIENYSSAQHDWMMQHGPDQGWLLPEWAQQNGSKPEPWHWEFGNIS